MPRPHSYRARSARKLYTSTNLCGIAALFALPALGCADDGTQRMSADNSDPPRGDINFRSTGGDAGGDAGIARNTTNNDAGSNGVTSVRDAATSEPAVCFGYSSADPTFGSFSQCLLERCCGSYRSCFDDATCKSTAMCAFAATTQASVNTCVAEIEGVENIASRLWFFNMYTCGIANCSGMLPRPRAPDACETYKDCRSCLNGKGRMEAGVYGNCGWLTDGTCHSGSTSGPDDPKLWGDGLKWSFFDDAACGGGSGSNSGGCTADVDCGSCERCERSTGKCLTRLTCN